MIPSAKGRPRLLYVNGPWHHLGERMRLSYVGPIRRLLERDFEVRSVATPCDLAEWIQGWEPQLIVLHTGCEAEGEPEWVVHNARHRPEIPRIALVGRDPFTSTRITALERIREWGADAVFVESRRSDYLVPPFTDAIYLPFWIEEEVFHDYGEEKTIELALTGAGWTGEDLYPWRRQVFLAAEPSLRCYHAASGHAHENTERYVGESYARLLNRSWFAAGCGSISRYLTRKLLEIPAARTCLVTEDTEVVRALDFRDGENCVLATGADVVAKVKALLADPPRLRAITDAGQALVRGAHLAAHRRQFAEWFALWQRRAPGERIIQTHPFRPLELLAAGAVAPAYEFPDENPMNATLLAAYRTLLAGDPAAALELFRGDRHAPWRAELRLGVALCLNLCGRIEEAYTTVSWNIGFALRMKMPHADPVDCAFVGLLALRRGDGQKAYDVLSTYPEMRHPALNAAREVFGKLVPPARREPLFAAPVGDDAANAASIHLLPCRTCGEWKELWLRHLRAPKGASAGSGVV